MPDAAFATDRVATHDHHATSAGDSHPALDRVAAAIDKESEMTQSARAKRRIIGMFVKRLGEARLDEGGRKALEPDGLPFGVIALDGKDTVVPACDDFFAQRQTASGGAPLAGAVRTVTATLVSSTPTRWASSSGRSMYSWRRMAGATCSASSRTMPAPARRTTPGRCATAACTTSSARATVVMMVLRRIAYTLLALWRGVTLRSDEQRNRSWRDVMRSIELAVIKATAEQLAGLRRHRLAPAPA
jgi:hypothetical protein